MEEGFSQIQGEEEFDNNQAEFNEVYVWGSDSKGQLGLCAQFDESFHPLPKICSFNVVIKSISAGEQHSVFVSESGHVYSMGSNEFG